MSKEFVAFPKIARVSRNMIITEKLDGTNACISIDEDGTLLIGSRKRWIVPGDDNAGFAKWVMENEECIRQLGVGVHHGEWWGQGIGRRYNLTEKRFSLFNTGRWRDRYTHRCKPNPLYLKELELCPECCHVVPVLYEGMFDTNVIDETMQMLIGTGSMAAPGFDRPEGVCIFHIGAYMHFKKTFEGDDLSKWELEQLTKG